MSDPRNLYSVDQWNVNFHEPTLVGPNRWAIGEEIITAPDDSYLLAEIHRAMDRVAKLEAIRQARTDVDTCVVFDRADELCQEFYGVTLDTFDRNGGKIHTRALFLMAQRELAREEASR